MRCGSPFSPSYLGGLAIWLRSDRGITLNGSDVSQWDDLSGNGRNAVQATAADQPVFVANAVNGRPVVRTDGVTEYMTVAGFSFTAITIILVVDVVDQTTNNIGIISFGAAANDHNDEDGLAIYVHATDNDFVFIRQVGASHLFRTGDLSSSAQIMTATFGDGSAEVRIDGVSVGTDAYDDLNAIDATDIILGERWVSGAAGDLNGQNDYAEIIMYNRVLVASEIVSVEKYLSARYDIGV